MEQHIVSRGEFGLPVADAGVFGPPPELAVCNDTEFRVGERVFTAVRCEQTIPRTVNGVRTDYSVVNIVHPVPSDTQVVSGVLSRRVTRLSDSVVVAEATLIDFTP